ncbi:MAG TPA: DUF4118 domain-containing protein, partial [Polyangiaceae bacterium]|nr:DUF4118 domain-containing protein [Polyangiaceae bacterium]
MSATHKKGGWSRQFKALGRDLLGLAVVGVITACGVVFNYANDVTNITIGYLFVVAAVSMYLGYRPALVAAAASALCIDYYFLPPLNTFVIAGGRDLVTMGSMFGCAIFISTLNERLRKQARAARQNERRVEALYGLVRELSDAGSTSEMCVGAAKQIEGVTGNEVCLLLKDDAGDLSSAFGAGGVAPVGSEDLDAASWAANHLEPAGAGTRNLPSGKTCYLPLIAGRGCIGVVSLRAREPGGAPARPSSLIVAMVNQCAMSIERGLLIDETQATRLEVETERIRNAVLSSVSHDLRTPLAIIGSAASTLMEHGDRLESKARTEMAKIVNDEARRLSELLKSLLDITRLQSGGLRVNRDWESLEEVIGSVLRRIEEQAGTGQVLANVPSTLPLVRIDAILIEQVLANLIDNALKYARSEGPIEINIAIRSELDVVVSVIDHGRGIPSGELTRIFEKFYRNGETSGTGLGLGLTIARGIVEAHGGRIWAVQTAGGGLT